MIASGDVDGDGFNELVVTDNNQLSGGSGRFRLYDGLSSGYYTTTPSWTYYDGYGSAVALADVDADGDLDLATGAWWDYTRLFFNDGQGFGSQPDWNSQITCVVEKIVFGDVNPTLDSVRQVTNTFGPTTDRLFHLSRKHIQSVDSVILDGQVLSPSQYTTHREGTWITVYAPPAVSLEVKFTYSVSLDMAVSTWDSSKGNYLYYNQLEPKWLASSPDTLSESTGGRIEFVLEAGAENAQRNYLLLGGVSGTSPGTPLPGGQVTLPLNWDLFTTVAIALANTAAFQQFMGTLDSQGSSTATMDTLGAIPGTAGITISFAYALNNPWNFVSNARSVDIVP